MSSDTKDCPFCGETIKAVAVRCRYCHADLTVAPPVAPVSAQASSAGASEPIEAEQVLDLLARLVDKNLAVYEEDEKGRGRYRLLETVRQYGRDRLMESGEREAEAVRSRHLTFLQERAAKPGTAFLGATAVEWIERLKAEHDNPRAALAWCRDGHGNAEDGLRLAVGVWIFWFTCGHHGEGRAWLEALIARCRPVPPPLLRARALGAAGFLAYCQAEYPDMAAMCRESLFLSRQAGDEECAAFALSLLAFAAFAEGDLTEAITHAEESVNLARHTGGRWNLFFALHILGLAVLLQGDPARATALQEESLVHGRAVGEMVGVAFALWALGEAERLLGRYNEATGRQKECLSASQNMGIARGAAHALEALAKVALALGWPERAARLFGAADTTRESAHAPLEPSFRPDHDQNKAMTQQALGEHAFASVFAEGRVMTLEQAVAYALEDELLEEIA